uniref:Uncharacterized protein n=1 Tax=Candidozyma auris TaxID=498019 RepID=A0A0L0P2Q9_CANAR
MIGDGSLISAEIRGVRELSSALHEYSRAILSCEATMSDPVLEAKLTHDSSPKFVGVGNGMKVIER